MSGSIRFVKSGAGNMVGMANCEVLVDTLTGVQYLYIKNMDGNLAVTPLLAPDGKPLLADPGNIYRQ
jgi:hypothetical protein